MEEVGRSADIRLDFYTCLKAFTIDPVDVYGETSNSPFVRPVALTEWLKEPTSTKATTSRAQDLLEGAFSYHDLPCSFSDKDIWHIDTRCPLMFCILLELKQGHLIKEFVHHKLHDDHLPLPLDDLQARMAPILTRNKLGKVAFVSEFCELQWKYFPITFCHGLHPPPLQSRRRLPICSVVRVETQRDQGKQENAAERYVITVSAEFIDAKIRALTQSSAFEHTRYGECYRFAMSKFDEGESDLFDMELRAHTLLQDHQHTRKALAVFSVAKLPPYHMFRGIIFETGQCSLRHFFSMSSPPSTIGAVEAFWSKIFDALMAIKDVLSSITFGETSDDATIDWLIEIDPGSMFLIDERLILSGPRLVHSRPRDTVRSKKIFMTLYKSATSIHIPAITVYPESIDSWPVVCTLAEIASWITLGESGRIAYMSIREAAIRRKRVSESNGSALHGPLHEAEWSLWLWHKEVLRQCVDSRDWVTQEVMHLIEEFLTDRYVVPVYVSILHSGLKRISQIVAKHSLAEYQTLDRVTDHIYRPFGEQEMPPGWADWTKLARAIDRGEEFQFPLGATLHPVLLARDSTLDRGLNVYPIQSRYPYGLLKRTFTVSSRGALSLHPSTRSMGAESINISRAGTMVSHLNSVRSVASVYSAKEYIDAEDYLPDLQRALD